MMHDRMTSVGAAIGASFVLLVFLIALFAGQDSIVQALIVALAAGVAFAGTWYPLTWMSARRRRRR